MGKCISASASLEDAGNNSNTDKQASEVKKEEPKPSPDVKKEVKPVKIEQAGSLSESDEVAEEPKPITNPPQKKEKEKEIEIEDEQKDKEEVKEEVVSKKVEKEAIPKLNYIEPTSDELSSQKELELAHVSHRGHFQNKSQFSAQNLLQHNSTKYVSLKSYHFNHYDDNDNDWFIFKITSNELIKITSLSIDYDINSLIEQYPSKISMQFLSTDSLNEAVSSSPKQWTKPYVISPHPLNCNKPIHGQQHTDSFNISISEKYLNELKNTKLDQYVRIEFMDGFGKNEDDGKYCVHHLRLCGVALCEDGILQNAISQTASKNYKVDLENKYSTKISPKPGPKDARVLMREHIFFVNTESKTINTLKQAICDEYGRLTKGAKNYMPKEMMLIEEKFGLINDLMDTAILNKTLPEIGIKPGLKGSGYFLTVCFM